MYNARVYENMDYVLIHFFGESYLFFEVCTLVWRHGICLGDNGYDVDFIVETLHKLHIKRL